MNKQELKSVVKKVITESIKKKDSSAKPATKKKTLKENDDRDEIGSFCMVHLPHKDSKIDDILTTHTLKDLSHAPVDMSKVAGVYKDELKARKLAEELLNHRTDVLAELKDSEIQATLDEIQNVKALMGATESYYKLKPSLDEDVSGSKIAELQKNLDEANSQLSKLQEEKLALEETRPGYVAKKEKPKAKTAPKK